MNPARHCAEMVKIRSENPPGDTREVICYLDGVLNDLGISGTITRNEDGRWNLVVDHPDNSLLLCGHVDVVPPEARRILGLVGPGGDGYERGCGMYHLGAPSAGR